MKTKIKMKEIKKIGTIPFDWETAKLSELTGFITKGATPTTYGYHWEEKGIPFFKSDCIKEGKFVYGDFQYIGEEAHNSLKRSKIQNGDILISITGDVGKVAIVPESISDGNINQHIARIRVKSSIVNRNFVYHWLNQKKIQNYYNIIKTGLAYPQISLEQVRNTEIPIPSRCEQDKISLILSTWDKAINLKESLIEQKQKKKKGLMQNLLTGKLRLSGFNEEWKELRIKDLGTLKGGSAFPEKYQNETSGKYPFFKVSDMNNIGNEKYMLVANNYISENMRLEIKATIIPKDSIVFAKVGAALLLERKRLLTYNSCIDNNMMALTVKKGINYNFVYYLFLNMKLSKFSNIGALPSLNAKDVYSLKCNVPVDYHEQTAIADILSLTDDEIDLLQSELKKLKHQKRGLMQLLLTGKVRV